jgi:hypothetical protein
MTTQSMGPRPYGPNTPAVRRFLQRLAALAESDWAAAADAFAASEGTSAFASADQALAIAIERSGRAADRDAVLGPLLQLVRRPATEPAAEPVEHPVAAAALGAVLALVVHDVLDEGAFGVLYAPFTTLVPLDALFA